MTDQAKAGWEVELFIDRLTRRDDTNSERLVLEAISHLRAFSQDCDYLRDVNTRLRTEIEDCHHYHDEWVVAANIRMVDQNAEITRLRAQRDQLFAALKEMIDWYGDDKGKWPCVDRALAAIAAVESDWHKGRTDSGDMM